MHLIITAYINEGGDGQTIIGSLKTIVPLWKILIVSPWNGMLQRTPRKVRTRHAATPKSTATHLSKVSLRYSVNSGCRSTVFDSNTVTSLHQLRRPVLRRLDILSPISASTPGHITSTSKRYLRTTPTNKHGSDFGPAHTSRREIPSILYRFSYLAPRGIRISSSRWVSAGNSQISDGNSLAAATCPTPNQSSAIISLSIATGSRYEAPFLQGISHFLSFSVLSQLMTDLELDQTQLQCTDQSTTMTNSVNSIFLSASTTTMSMIQNASDQMQTTVRLVTNPESHTFVIHTPIDQLDPVITKLTIALTQFQWLHDPLRLSALKSAYITHLSNIMADPNIRARQTLITAAFGQHGLGAQSFFNSVADVESWQPDRLSQWLRHTIFANSFHVHVVAPNHHGPVVSQFSQQTKKFLKSAVNTPAPVTAYIAQSANTCEQRHAASSMLSGAQAMSQVDAESKQIDLQSPAGVTSSVSQSQPPTTPTSTKTTTFHAHLAPGRLHPDFWAATIIQQICQSAGTSIGTDSTDSNVFDVDLFAYSDASLLAFRATQPNSIQTDVSNGITTAPTVQSQLCSYITLIRTEFLTSDRFEAAKSHLVNMTRQDLSRNAFSTALYIANQGSLVLTQSRLNVHAIAHRSNSNSKIAPFSMPNCLDPTLQQSSTVGHDVIHGVNYNPIDYTINLINSVTYSDCLTIFDKILASPPTLTTISSRSAD